MLKAFLNVSSVLGGYWGMKKMNLKWKQFFGNVSQFYDLFHLFESHNIMDFTGLKGQREVADKVFNGDNRRAYKNVSALREVLFGDRKAFNHLKWSAKLK